MLPPVLCCHRYTRKKSPCTDNWLYLGTQYRGFTETSRERFFRKGIPSFWRASTFFLIRRGLYNRVVRRIYTAVLNLVGLCNKIASLKSRIIIEESKNRKKGLVCGLSGIRANIRAVFASWLGAACIPQFEFVKVTQSIIFFRQLPSAILLKRPMGISKWIPWFTSPSANRQLPEGTTLRA